MKHRTLLLLAFLVALPAWPAFARDRPFRLASSDLELLPVHDEEWVLLARDHPDVIGRMLVLARHVGKVTENLARRENPADAGSRGLRADVDRTVADLADLFERIRVPLARLGVDDDILAVVRSAPEGRLRPLRQALRLVPRAPGLDAGTRALHADLGAAVEGALLSLDDAVRRQAIEHRYWRVVDATLDRAQRTWLRRRLPSDVAKSPDLIGHVFTLPGLDASQIARLRSLLVGVQAATAPDRAAMGRGDLTAAMRLAGAAADAWDEGMGILTSEQRAALAARPPRLSAKERAEGLEEVVRAAGLTPAQLPAARALQRKYAPVKGRLAEALLAAAMRTRGEAPESPAYDAAEALRIAAYADALASGRRAAREVFGDLLTRDQILAWVLGPTG